MVAKPNLGNRKVERVDYVVPLTGALPTEFANVFLRLLFAI